MECWFSHLFFFCHIPPSLFNLSFSFFMPLSFDLYLLILPIFLPHPHPYILPDPYPFIHVLSSILFQKPSSFPHHSIFISPFSFFNLLHPSLYLTSPTLHLYLILIHPSNYSIPWNPLDSPPFTSLYIFLVPPSDLSLHFSFSVLQSFSVYLLIILPSLPHLHAYILHHFFSPLNSTPLNSSVSPSLLPTSSHVHLNPFLSFPFSSLSSFNFTSSLSYIFTSSSCLHLTSSPYLHLLTP